MAFLLVLTAVNVLEAKVAQVVSWTVDEVSPDFKRFTQKRAEEQYH